MYRREPEQVLPTSKAVTERRMLAASEEEVEGRIGGVSWKKKVGGQTYAEAKKRMRRDREEGGVTAWRLGCLGSWGAWVLWAPPDAERTADARQNLPILRRLSDTLRCHFLPSGPCPWMILQFFPPPRAPNSRDYAPSASITTLTSRQIPHETRQDRRDAEPSRYVGRGGASPEGCSGLTSGSRCSFSRQHCGNIPAGSVTTSLHSNFGHRINTFTTTTLSPRIRNHGTKPKRCGRPTSYRKKWHRACCSFRQPKEAEAEGKTGRQAGSRAISATACARRSRQERSRPTRPQYPQPLQSST